MSIYYLCQDPQRCIYCHSCEVQCKVNKGISVGPKPNQVMHIGPKITGNKARATYFFISCLHCQEPFCVPACPTGAMQKRISDGIVFIDENLCIGCRSCIMACPWGAPQWDAERGKVVKCDYCKDRLDKGLKPACAASCPTESLIFGLANEMPNIRRFKFARELFGGR